MDTLRQIANESSNEEEQLEELKNMPDYVITPKPNFEEENGENNDSNEFMDVDVETYNFKPSKSEYPPINIKPHTLLSTYKPIKPKTKCPKEENKQQKYDNLEYHPSNNQSLYPSMKQLKPLKFAKYKPMDPNKMNVTQQNEILDDDDDLLDDLDDVEVPMDMYKNSNSSKQNQVVEPYYATNTQFSQPYYQNNANAYYHHQSPPQQVYAQHPPNHQYTQQYHQQSLPQNHDHNKPSGYPNIYNQSKSMNSIKMKKKSASQDTQSGGVYPNIYKNSTSQSPEQTLMKTDDIHIDDNNDDSDDEEINESDFSV